MKKLLIILLFAFSILNGQNICTEVLTRYNYTTDAFYSDTVSVNITAMRINNQMNANSASLLVELNGYKMSVDTFYDYRMAYGIFALNAFCNWGQTPTLNLFKGDYPSSGLDSNQIGFFDIYMSNNTLSQDRLLIHTRHELEARNPTLMDNLIDSICVGLRFYDNQIVVGRFINYSEPRNEAYLLEKDEIGAWVVNIYSISKATNEEKQKYY